MNIIYFRNTLCSLIASMFMLIIPVLIFSQDVWEQTNGPYGALIKTTFIADENQIFAGDWEGNIFISIDNGLSWDKINIGLFDEFHFYETIVSNSAGQLFASGTIGIIKSTDNGQNWMKTNMSEWIYQIVVNSSNHIIASTNGVYISQNNGDSWEQILEDINIIDIAIDLNDNIFAGSYAMFKRSSDNGKTWQDLDLGISSFSINQIAVNSKGDIFVGVHNYNTTSYDVYVSKDEGTNWSSVYTNHNQRSVRFISINYEDDVYVRFWGKEGDLIKSEDDGESWIDITPAVKLLSKFSFNSQGHIYSGSRNGVEISKDGGFLWETQNIGMHGLSIVALASDDHDHVFAGSENSGCFVSRNYGDSWERIHEIPSTGIPSIVINQSGEIFIATNENGIYHSKDTGSTWDNLSDGLNETEILSMLVSTDNFIYVGTYHGVYRWSSDNSQWINIGLEDYIIEALSVNSQGFIYAGTYENGLFKSSDLGVNWQNIFNQYYVSDISINSDDDIFVNSFWASLYRSTDDGNTWQLITVGLETFSVYSLDIYQNILYAGAIGGLYYSDNYGELWQLIDSTGLETNRVYSTSMLSDSVIFAGTEGSSVYKRKIILDNKIPEQLPTTVNLKQNFPNPFNSGTFIQYSLPPNQSSYKVSLKIYNVLGQQVKVLKESSDHSDIYTLKWDGKNNVGTEVPSGIYFYKLVANNFTVTKKMLLVR